jgi:hypothetical protein
MKLLIALIEVVAFLAACAVAVDAFRIAVKMRISARENHKRSIFDPQSRPLLHRCLLFAGLMVAGQLFVPNLFD